LSTKIHAAVDALGNPLRLIVTSGQASEFGQALHLIEGWAADYVLADKGYDSDHVVAAVENSGAVAVIPSRRHRTICREHDREIYKERNLVERFFQKLKQFRRIATRYEKLKRNYQAMLELVCAIIWLT
jgi:transposase